MSLLILRQFAHHTGVTALDQDIGHGGCKTGPIGDCTEMGLTLRVGDHD
jgi:hypothetical protein